MTLLSVLIPLSIPDQADHVNNIVAIIINMVLLQSYQEDINNYHQKGFDDEENEEEESLMDILDLLTIDENRKLEMVFELIDDLDLEVINEMKVRIDNRLTH